MSGKPAFTYWVTGRDTRSEIAHRRCTTCGNPETYPVGKPPRTPCQFQQFHHGQRPEYTSRSGVR